MHVIVMQHAVVINRGDARRAPTETAFWHALKQYLNARGHDLVKKVMSKDGHLVGGDDYPYYLRDRQWGYCIADSDYMLRAVHHLYNSGGEVKLALTRWSGDNPLSH